MITSLSGIFFIYWLLLTALKCLLLLPFAKNSQLFPLFTSRFLKFQILWSPFPYTWGLHFLTPPPPFFNLIALDFSLHFFTGTFLLLEKMGTFQCFFRLPSWKPLALWRNLLFLKCSFTEFYEIALFISSGGFCLVPQTMLGPLLYASGRGFNMEVLAESLKIYQSEVPSQDGNF